jgi:hypothetical protein
LVFWARPMAGARSSPSPAASSEMRIEEREKTVNS